MMHWLLKTACVKRYGLGQGWIKNIALSAKSRNAHLGNLVTSWRAAASKPQHRAFTRNQTDCGKTRDIAAISKRLASLTPTDLCWLGTGKGLFDRYRFYAELPIKQFRLTLWPLSTSLPGRCDARPCPSPDRSRTHTYCRRDHRFVPMHVPTTWYPGSFSRYAGLPS